ncbi:MAG: DUF1624 domain-containing protein [Clostridia bacterium]|nr:DUF1624 domain-containing protein [Clostridia bacterium]
MEKRERFYFIDVLRGIAVLSMVLYHFMWDLRFIARLPFKDYPDRLDFLWQQSICWTFILVSGFCFYLARRPFINGIKVLLGGVLVSLVTIFLTPDSAIYFGVLIFHGSAMLITLPLRKFLYKIPPILGAVLSFLLFVFFYSVSDKSLAFGLIELPKSLYQNMFTAYLGFPHSGFFSADYFPLLPWIFLFLTGFFLSGTVKEKPPKFLYFKVPVFEWIGKNALIIYLLHQPVLYAVTELIITLRGV